MRGFRTVWRVLVTIQLAYYSPHLYGGANVTTMRRHRSDKTMRKRVPAVPASPVSVFVSLATGLVCFAPRGQPNVGTVRRFYLEPS